jgi:phage FluMu gp28-like protein
MNQCYEEYGSEAASNTDKLVVQVILEQEKRRGDASYQVHELTLTDYLKINE